MYEKDFSIISRANIQSDVVVVNQCDTTSKEIIKFHNKKNQECTALFINTPERGLSRSRNVALTNAWGDICILCDDDETFLDEYVSVVETEYLSHKDCDIITFEVKRDSMKAMSERRMNWFNALKVASVTISFKRESIIHNGIFFDETVGSGVAMAGGEENVFLYDCLRNNLRGLITPVVFAVLNKSESKWFKGFTREYFYDRGIMTRRLMGKFLALIYAVYFIIIKRKAYNKDIKSTEAIIYLVKGIFNNK